MNAIWVLTQWLGDNDFSIGSITLAICDSEVRAKELMALRVADGTNAKNLEINEEPINTLLD